MTSKRETSVDKARKGPNLRSLVYTPNENPLLNPVDIKIKKRRVSTRIKTDMVDPMTGVLAGGSAVYTIEDKDDEQFVKVFSDGVKAAYGLSKTAARVFQLVLSEYENTPMTKGYVDSVYLAWFDGGLSGQKIGMLDKTFQTGLKELLGKGFIAPRGPNLFWVNPALFFKGDRCLFVKEYRRVAKTAVSDDAAAVRDRLEADGQQRLID